MERTAMENLVLLKLIFRNWWRNRLFAVISLVSLVVGISCTNLLISFVIHEYTIEGENPKKDRILRLTQRLPSMQSTGQVSFVYGGTSAFLNRSLLRPTVLSAVFSRTRYCPAI